MAQIIAAVQGVFQIFDLVAQAFPPPQQFAATLRVGAGLSSNAGEGLGGSTPDIRLWNQAGGFLGIAEQDEGSVDNGGIWDTTVHMGESNQQATYGLFTANVMPVCIAYVTVTWPDGNRYGWTGDWAPLCNASWYHSEVRFQGSSYKPSCAWIAQGGEVPETGMSIHFPDFVTSSGVLPDDFTRDTICANQGSMLFHMEPDPKTIMWREYHGQGPTGDPETSLSMPLPELQPPVADASLDLMDVINVVGGIGKRGLQESPELSETQRKTLLRRWNQQPRHDGRLVISNRSVHSAKDLCESASSIGPDFVNVHEGIFCDMTARRLWPLCTSDQRRDRCFDVDARRLIVAGANKRHPGYHDVTEWTAEEF